MLMELSGDDFFQDLREERQIGDGPVVAVNFRVEGGFFQERCNDGSLKGRWNVACLEGEVDDCGDEGADGGDVGF